MNIEKKFQRLRRVNDIYESMLSHYNNEEKQRKLNFKRIHNNLINVISIRKMYGRTLEELYDYICFYRKNVERAREKIGDMHYLDDEYEAFGGLMESVVEMRMENGMWLLNLSSAMEQAHLELSDLELQTAFSIPMQIWNQCAFNIKKRKRISMVLKIGDRAFANHVIEASIKEVMSNRRTKKRVMAKARQMFSRLF